MVQFVNTQFIPAITKAASFAAYSVALLTTGDASFATALHNLQIEDLVMNESIKKRIEAVRRGEVPEGYRRTRAGLMPLEWQGNLIAKDVFRNHTNKKHNGEFQVLSATQDRGIIPRSEVDIDIKYAEENIGSYKKVDSGDFVISLRSFQGGIEY